MENEAFADRLEGVLLVTGLDAGRLTLEIDETHTPVLAPPIDAIRSQ